MYTDSDEIKSKHKGDIRTLWKIYQSDEPFFKNYFFKVSGYLAFAFTLISLFTTVDTYALIIHIVNTGIGILPNLLGFNLGAYILIVGFGGTEILSVITRPLKGQDNYSFYQKLNGVLGIAVIVQILTLVTLLLLNLWEDIQDKFIWELHNNVLIKGINVLTLFLISLFSFYSILILVNVIKHVFMFAQTIHFCIYTDRLKKINDEEEKIKNKHP